MFGFMYSLNPLLIIIKIRCYKKKQREQCLFSPEAGIFFSTHVSRVHLVIEGLNLCTINGDSEIACA